MQKIIQNSALPLTLIAVAALSFFTGSHVSLDVKLSLVTLSLVVLLGLPVALMIGFQLGNAKAQQDFLKLTTGTDYATAVSLASAIRELRKNPKIHKLIAGIGRRFSPDRRSPEDTLADKFGGVVREALQADSARESRERENRIEELGKDVAKAITGGETGDSTTEKGQRRETEHDRHAGAGGREQAPEEGSREGSISGAGERG